MHVLRLAHRVDLFQVRLSLLGLLVLLPCFCSATYNKDGFGEAFSQNTRVINATLACQEAQAVLGSSSVDTVPLNQTTVDVNWSEACWLKPTCIAQPSSAEEVATILTIIQHYQVEFSVRSGGHSPNPGWSSIADSGILIDLARLDQITVNDDYSVASIGPGQRWGIVQSTLDPYNVSVIGGRDPTVGVGGLILGGGYFHFSGRYGLAADNVRTFQVVLANGSLIEASASDNWDLFWALKGGGPNFGIVTRYDLYTIPIRNIWYELVLYAVDQILQVMDAFASWQINSGNDTDGNVAVVISTSYAAVGFIYASPQVQRPDVFEAFNNITVLEVSVEPTNGTVSELTTLLGEVTATADGRHDYRSAVTQVDASIYKEAWRIWAESAAAVYNETGATQTFVMQAVAKGLVQQGQSRGGNPLGLPQQNMMWWTTTVTWENAADDDQVRNTSIITSEVIQGGSDIDFLYMNDCSRDQQPLTTYGSDNVSRLKSVSQAYDPSQVFQILQKDGFLLRKV